MANMIDVVTFPPVSYCKKKEMFNKVKPESELGAQYIREYTACCKEVSMEHVVLEMSLLPTSWKGTVLYGNKCPWFQ